MGKGRPVFYDKVYNQEIKERFLDNQNYTTESKTTYMRRFARFYEYEVMWGKDLYDFTNAELEDMLSALASKTHVGLHAVKSIIASYKDFAIREKYSKDTINMTRYIDVEKIEGMVNKTSFRQQYLTGLPELWEIIDFCENFQDKALFILLFFLIRKSRGGKEYDEIINLKTEDCNFETGEIRLLNDRMVLIPQEFLRILKLASIQTEYKIIRSEAEEEKIKEESKVETVDEITGEIKITYKKKKRDYCVIPESEYFIKNSRQNKKTENRIMPNMVNTRIKRISELYGKPNLIATNVFYSGIFYRLMELEKIKAENKEELTMKDFEDIREECNLSGDTNAATTKRLYEQYKEAMKTQQLINELEKQEKRRRTFR